MVFFWQKKSERVFLVTEFNGTKTQVTSGFFVVFTTYQCKLDSWSHEFGESAWFRSNLSQKGDRVGSYYCTLHNIKFSDWTNTVDGRNHEPVDIPLFTVFFTSQVVQDFFHQQYYSVLHVSSYLFQMFLIWWSLALCREWFETDRFVGGSSREAVLMVQTHFVFEKFSLESTGAAPAMKYPSIVWCQQLSYECKGFIGNKALLRDFFSESVVVNFHPRYYTKASTSRGGIEEGGPLDSHDIIIHLIESLFGRPNFGIKNQVSEGKAKHRPQRYSSYQCAKVSKIWQFLILQLYMLTLPGGRVWSCKHSSTDFTGVNWVQTIPYLHLLTSVAAKLATRIRPQTKTFSHHMPSRIQTP